MMILRTPVVCRAPVRAEVLQSHNAAGNHRGTGGVQLTRRHRERGQDLFEAQRVDARRRPERGLVLYEAQRVEDVARNLGSEQTHSRDRDCA